MNNFVRLHVPLALAFAAPLCLAAGAAHSQQLELPRPSPLAKASQAVGLTDVSIEYSSPAVKGRKVWGGLVPLGQLWRTGANMATKLTFSKDVTIADKPVPAGTYALVKNTSKSTATHLVLDLVGPAGSVSGVGFHLSADQTKVTWTTVDSGDPEKVKSSTFSNTLVKSKVTGDTLQAGVYQKGTTAAVAATTSTVLASVALDLKGSIPVNSTVSFSAVAGKALDRGDLGAGALHGEDRAALDRLAVDMHDARAALRGIASDMRAC